MKPIKSVSISFALAASLLLSGCGPQGSSQSDLKVDSSSANYKTNILTSGQVQNSVDACKKAQADAAKKNRLKSIFQSLATSVFGFIPIPGAAIVGKVVNTTVSTSVNLVLPSVYSANCDINDIRIQALSEEVTAIYNELKTEISSLKGSVNDAVANYLAADLSAMTRGLLELSYNTDYEYKMSSKHAGIQVFKKAAAGGNGVGGNSADQELIPVDGDMDWVRVFKYDTKTNLNATIAAGNRTLASIKSGHSLLDNSIKPGSRDFFAMLKLIGTVVLPGFGAADQSVQLLDLALKVQTEGKYTEGQVSLPEIKTLTQDSIKELYTMISSIKNLVENNPGVEIKIGPGLPKLEIKEKRTNADDAWVDLIGSATERGGPHWTGADEQFRVKSSDNGVDYTITVFGKDGGAKIVSGKLILAGQQWGIPIPKSAGTLSNAYGHEYIAYNQGYFTGDDFKKLLFDLIAKKVLNGDFPDATAASLKKDFYAARDMYDTLNTCQFEAMQLNLEKEYTKRKLPLNALKGISENVEAKVSQKSKKCGPTIVEDETKKAEY